MDPRHRDALTSPTPYANAGKRRKGTPATSVDSGRHRAAIQRTTSGEWVAGVAPRALGLAAIAGAMSGALLTDARDVATRPAAELQGVTGQVQVQASTSIARDEVISRSQERKAQGEALASKVADAADERESALGTLERQARRKARTIMSDVWVLPMKSYRLTGTFGESSRLWSTVHTGLDFAAPTGSPIVAVASGVVTEAGWAGAYGYRTIVTLSDGTELWFCHQSSIAVDVGDQVDRGVQIGKVGSTGNVTGPHLHLEVRPGGGDPVDPWGALKEHRATA